MFEDEKDRELGGDLIPLSKDFAEGSCFWLGGGPKWPPGDSILNLLPLVKLCGPFCI